MRASRLPYGASGSPMNRRTTNWLSAVLDPKLWWLGAIHIVPKDMTVPTATLIPNGLYVTVESAAEVTVRTAQGNFSFRPSDLCFAEARLFLNGRATVERVAQARQLTSADGMENDFPAAAFAGSEAWVAWVGYSGEHETLSTSGG